MQDERALLLAAEDEILDNCTRCHGHGYDPDDWGGQPMPCNECGGLGTKEAITQREESFSEWFDRL